MATPSAYKPTSYAPSNVTNGQSGATTPESERNAALQATGNTGANPYSEAILHTQNWLQYMVPPSQKTTAPVRPATAPYETPPTVNMPVGAQQPQAATLPSTLAPTTPVAAPQALNQGEVPTPDGDTVPPPTEAPPPPTAPTPDNPRGPRPVNPASDDEIINGLVTKYGYKPEYAKTLLDRARAWSKTPGYGWLTAHPEIIAMYEADPKKEGDFTEWVARSWEGLVSKGLVPNTPETAEYNAQARLLGYDRWAARLKQTHGIAVTGAQTKAYDEWYRWATANNVPTQDFLTWYGDPNNPNGGHYVPKGRNGNGRPLPDGSNNGQAPPPAPGSTDPTGTGAPNSMDDLIRALRDQGREGRDMGLRQFRHEAGLSGLNDTGAYNPALADMINKSIMNENSAIYEIINAKDEGERNRALQKYMAEIGAEAQIAGASAGASGAMYAADRNLEASKYSDDIRKLLGLTGFDVERENNWWQNQNNMQQTILDYLRMIYGSSPDVILGGNPIPGGDGF